jgi:acetolactate synthase-1/2/3 large subunit
MNIKIEQSSREHSGVGTTRKVVLPNGVTLFVEQAGNKGDLVIFLHAVGGDRSSWHKQMAELSDRYFCVSSDFRGHGASTCGAAGEDAASSVSIDSFAQDTIYLIEHLGYGRAHLVGLSMGGVVALEVFRKRPDLVQSLALANSWAYHPVGEGRITFMKDQLATMSLAESAAALIPGLLAAGTPEEVIKQAVAVESGKDPAVYLSSWVSMFHIDHRDILEKIDVPVLLIGGSGDQVTPTNPLLTEIKSRVATAQLVEIEGANHFSNLDHPVEFNRALRSHLMRARLPYNQRLVSAKARQESFSADTVAQGLVGLLARRGVDCLFANSGTDFTPIIDALARYKDEPDFSLKTVLVPHENTAIAAAHGYYLVTGRPQAVMAHVNVGTANMGLGIINAARARIPMLVLAGATPWYEDGVDGCRTNFVQWGQDTFDQGASFREFTKWDYELKGANNLETVLDRALAIAQSDPAGPVYLTLPKEVLCQKIESGAMSFSEPARQQAAPAGQPAVDLLERAARMISEAENPLIITAELGRYRRGPEALVQLAQNHAIPVIEHGKRNFFNFPTDHPMHLGFAPQDAVAKADLLIVVESHVPYIPVLCQLESPPAVIQLGVDPLCQNIPMRSFPVDLAVAGCPASILRLLNKRLTELMGPLCSVDKRAKALAAEHERISKQALSEAQSDSSRSAITKRYLSYCIGQMVDDDVVIFNEYDLDPQLVPRRIPDSWFENSIASGLGWSLGAALGAKMARPEQTMIVTLGDGSYLFNTPLSAHYLAGASNLPVLIIIFNDSAWSTIKKSYKGTTPGGWAQRKDYFPLCDFDLSIQYEKLAESCGGLGLVVDKPADLPAVLARALACVRTEGRHVLVNVICERDG